MSYVPKYVLKRMVPQDAAKAVEGGIQLTILNLITTIPADQIPGDPLDIIEIKLNGEQLTKEEMEKITVTLDDKTIKFGNLQDAGSVPVNTKMIFFLPTDKLKAGDAVKAEIDIQMVNVHIEVERTIQ